MFPVETEFREINKNNLENLFFSLKKKEKTVAVNEILPVDDHSWKTASNNRWLFTIGNGCLSSEMIWKVVIEGGD